MKISDSPAHVAQEYLGIKPIYCLLFIFAIAIFFRVFNISHTSLWTDELATYWAATAPTVGESIDRVAATQGQSPLYFLLERFILDILPANEFSVRLLSLAASLISVFLMYSLGKLIFSDEKKALFASLLFAIHEVSIYYAQEARAYSLGIMFALLGQIYFLKLFRRKSFSDLILYMVFSTLTFYSHYIFASILIVQNLYYLYVILGKKSKTYPSLLKWCSSQVITALTIPVLLFQLSGMFSNRVGWDWVKQMNLIEAASYFLSMFDLKILLIAAVCFIIFHTIEAVDFKTAFKDTSCEGFLLVTWLLVPFIFVLLVSRVLGVSLFDHRYMVMSLIPFYFMISYLVHIFKSDVLRVAFPGAFIVIYLGLASIPNYMSYGHFSYRIQHNWRGAVSFVNKNYKTGDVILLRSGFVNENWIPTSENRIIQDYVKAPFRSFYWKEKAGLRNPTIYNLTYTWEKDFYPYYDMIFDKVTGYDRIWLVGVNTPNTNYPVSRISSFLEKEFQFYKIYEANYSGVYLCLMSSNPFNSKPLSF
ncbi:MAG: glycosyltransferase family 39 protein [Victivallales bacterium]